jgi:hypothetical protein
MLSIEDFKKMCGVEKIQFYKGTGREFATTPIGKVFVAEKTKFEDASGNKVPVYVIEGKGTTKKGESLVGTYWFVNSAAQLSREV